MRIPLKLPQAASPRPSTTQPKQSKFASRLAEACTAAPADDPENDPILRESIKQYLQQNALMMAVMSTPGPLPDRETD
jgi:hypothetical protein